MDLSRRGFMIVGTTSLLSLDGGLQRQVGSQQAGNDYQFQGVADLLGAREARPEPGDGFFEDKIAFAYRYEVEGTGERFFITDGDENWTRLVGPARWDMSVELTKSELGNGMGTIFAEPGGDQWKIRQVSDDGKTFREGTVAWTETAMSVVEDFERTNPVAAYAGDTGEFAEETTTVYHGSKALVSNPASLGPWSISDTGVTTQQGKTYRARLRVGTSDAKAFGWFLFTQAETREPNGYLININDTRVSLFVNNGGYTKLAGDTNFTRGAGIWYDVEADITNTGDWTVTVYDDTGTQVAQPPTVTDNTFTSGGIGWRNDGQEDRYYDYARVV